MISVSILSVLAQADTRKALEAATREEILKQQDDAIYKRRNAAIEQERIVRENELNMIIRFAIFCFASFRITAYSFLSL